MMRPFAARAATAATAATALWLSACNPPAEPEADQRPETAALPSTSAPSAAEPPEGGAATPAATGAPAFAVIYPGGRAEGPPTLAQGPVGPGGIIVFTTEATPDQVVAFYKQRAEASGLRSITAMNQGDARGYSAGDGADGRGQLLSVVATPLEGMTSVQLDWSAGR